MPNIQKPFVVIITGPTASGKTGFSYDLARQLPIEIINADAGQFYVPLTIGTAKPDWQNKKTPAHLFDISQTPDDITVHQYQSMVIKTAIEITKRGSIPCLVGGSLFYLKSLLFPTPELPDPTPRAWELVTSIPPEKQWHFLNSIDPARAAAIHPNDPYRLERSLLIWFTTNKLPSSFQPTFNPLINVLFAAITPPKELLHKRINKRTVEMISNEGWVEEAERLMETPWKPFLERKGLIGYRELFKWLSSNRKAPLQGVISTIQQETRRYAKRQMTFINGLFEKLSKVEGGPSQPPTCLRVADSSQESIKAIAKAVLEEKNKFLVGKKQVLR